MANKLIEYETDCRELRIHPYTQEECQAAYIKKMQDMQWQYEEEQKRKSGQRAQ